jgi:hypothetical protein
MRNRITGDRSNRLVFGGLIAAIVIGFLLSLLPLRAAAHDHHSYHAEFYSKWVTREGISCCNANDCQPIDDRNVRVRSQGVEVYVEGEWVPVSPEKIRPYHAPDMNNHLCHLGRIIFCFVFGGGA